jgi:hypothetical protein
MATLLASCFLEMVKKGNNSKGKQCHWTEREHNPDGYGSSIGLFIRNGIIH